MTTSTDIRQTAYVAGHAGLVGSAVVRRLDDGGQTDTLIATAAT